MSDLFDCLVKGDVDGVRAAVTGLAEARRRELGDELVAHVRRRRDNWWWNNEATALAVAAVGCLGTATKAAALLGRRSVSLQMADPTPVLAVARERGVTWLADLGYRLAAKLTPRRPADGWSFAATLLLAEQAPPPTTDPFVEGWVLDLRWSPRSRPQIPLLDRLRADPFLDALAPRMFEVDGLGTSLASWPGVDEAGLPPALAQLAAEGRLDRTMLVDGCLGRLLRGDRPSALRPFVVLHDLLAPTDVEVVARTGDYLRLLTDGPGPVATMAQRTLRGLGDDIELDGLLDASRVVLTRPEKALVRTQLSWLDRLARQRTDRAAGIAAVIAVAADHPAADLRDRAGDLARKHGHQAFGPVTVVTAGDDLPPPTPPAAAPPPIADVDELAEEVAALFGHPPEPLTMERVLDGLVRFSGEDRPRLGGALRPVLDRHRTAIREEHWPGHSGWGLFSGLLVAAADLGEATARRGRWTTLLTESRRQGLGRSGRPAPQQLLLTRLAEVGERLGSPGDPGLLAAPTTVTGAIDPAVLYARVAALGNRPSWRWDLTQALLRLPAVVDEELAARAAALGTRAGDLLSEYLHDGGLRQPTYQVVTVDRRERTGRHDWWYHHLPERRTLVEATPPEGFDDPLGLLTITTPPISGRHWHWSGLWPALLPAHRGLVATHLLPSIAAAADQDARDAAAILPVLAECTGPGGPALDLALAYGLTARHEVDRIAALDALLMLAAAGDLDAPAVGGHLGTLAVAGRVTLSRATGPLRDAAAAGARASTCRLLTAALPALLAAPIPPRGTPDLLTLAAETATSAGQRIEVPGLADVVARGGGSRLVTEARRLTRALAA